MQDLITLILTSALIASLAAYGILPFRQQLAEKGYHWWPPVFILILSAVLTLVGANKVAIVSEDIGGRILACILVAGVAWFFYSLPRA